MKTVFSRTRETPARSALLDPVSSEISDLRNFWLHAMCACTE